MKYPILLIALILSISFSGLIFAQDLPANNEDASDKPVTDENKPLKPPVPFKYLEGNSAEEDEPEIPAMKKLLIQFLFDSKLEDKFKQLTNFMKNLAEIYGDKIYLRATDINKDEKAKIDWDKLLKVKKLKETDVIVLIVDAPPKKIKYTIGLNDIIKTLAGHINFALEPDKFVDPLNNPGTGTMRSENFSTRPQFGNQPPAVPDSPDNSGTIIVQEDEFKGKFEVLISIFIAFFALVVGFFVAWLVLRNRKPAANAPIETETVETE